MCGHHPDGSGKDDSGKATVLNVWESVDVPSVWPVLLGYKLSVHGKVLPIGAG